jgi:hypothetical protein
VDATVGMKAVVIEVMTTVAKRLGPHLLCAFDRYSHLQVSRLEGLENGSRPVADPHF